MKKKQYMMMATFLCTTTMAMAAPVNINTNQPYNAKNGQMEGHAPLENSASVISSDKEYRLRQGDELNIQVVQQAELGTRNVMTLCIPSDQMDMYRFLWLVL